MLTSPVLDELRLTSGVDIAALLVLDVDSSGVLANVEVLLDPEEWETGDVPTRPPGPVEAASLVLPRAALDAGSFDWLEPRVRTDQSQSRAVVELEPMQTHTRWVALSESCDALLDGGFLTGFVARLDVPRT